LLRKNAGFSPWGMPSYPAALHSREAKRSVRHNLNPEAKPFLTPQRSTTETHDAHHAAVSQTLTSTPLKHRMAKVDRQKAKYPKRNQQQRPPPLQPRRLLTRQAHTKPPIDAFKSYPRTNPPPNPPLCRRPECRRSRNNSPRNQPTQKGLNIRMLIATEDRQPRDLRLLPPSPGFRNMCHDLLPVNLSIRSTEFLCELTHHTIQSVIAFQDELIIELSSPIADWFNDVHIQIWLS